MILHHRAVVLNKNVLENAAVGTAFCVEALTEALERFGRPHQSLDAMTPDEIYFGLSHPLAKAA